MSKTTNNNTAPEGVVDAANALADGIVELNRQITSLKKKQTMERKWRLAFICLFIFDFVITPFFGVVAVKAFTNGSNTNQALSVAQTALNKEHQALIKSCRDSNVSATGTNGLFDYLFNELLFGGPTIDPKVWDAKLPTVG